MTGFEYNYEERPGDYSDQSDYDAQDFELATGVTSGESSLPESPAKSTSRLCETLPKISVQGRNIQRWKLSNSHYHIDRFARKAAFWQLVPQAKERKLHSKSITDA